jgi:4-diphosphocytidyl-2-C-methyl-D-erythritol kinase
VQVIAARAPAKLNLHLSVGPRRADGFHELATVYQAVSLYDEVSVERARRLTVSARGEGSGSLPRGADNLAGRAAEALAAHLGRRPAVRITIDKTIPVAAGLAGGSADAAATLLACDALWNAGLDRDELAAIAAELGSDVPFALHGAMALGTGRGERLAPVLGRGSYHWVLAFAHGTLATPGVYAELDRQRAASRTAGSDRPSTASTPDPVLAAVATGDAPALGRALANDLQPAALALRPELRRVLDSGAELGALGGLVSGSGPTVALLSRNRKDAIALAAGLAGLAVCRTVRQVDAPAPGARIAGVTAGQTGAQRPASVPRRRDEREQVRRRGDFDTSSS